jgi:two-component system, chemotaxis family, response regulator Rcp1
MNEIHILLIEDNEGDVVLTLEALKEGKVDNKVSVIRDGLEALQFLMQEGKYEHALPPDLILLDINLPKVDGKEVLAGIKADEQLKKIPVIVLTTSSSEKDILDSYNLHANSYITKPVSLNAFLEVIRSIENYWIRIVQLPKT